MIEIALSNDRHICDVIIGSKLLGQAGSLLATKLPSRRCAIISDSNIAPRFAPELQKGLTSGGIQSVLITVEAGEQFKTLPQVGAVCDQMLEAGMDRQAFVVGLGGGVIGDMSGFIAAIFQRGIPHVQIPTTLLAMVDSSIGGKTGVNTAAGKNLIGAVHPATVVIDDVEVLRTLPVREFKQGFAEIIKHGIIADAEMFERLSSTGLSAFTPNGAKNETLASLIRRNIEIKSGIVRKDELDRTGERALLNFGHTIGHGIERAGNYTTFLHGEAISLGMVAAVRISIKRAGLKQEEGDQIIQLLQGFQLPARLPGDFPRQRILDALKFDKKFKRGEIRFVVTPQIGSAYLSSEVTLGDIREAVEQL